MKKILCCLFVLICACSWRSPDSHFYMMNSQNLQAVSDKKANIAVAKIKVPDLLDRAQMVVYENGNDQVQIMEFSRWGEIFPDVLQATVVNDLIAYLPRSFVKRTYFDDQNVNYNVNIEVNTLKAYRNDKVILSAWWNIANANGKVLVRQQGTYETKVHGRSIEDLVNAQSESVHLMAKDIAEHLVKL